MLKSAFDWRYVHLWDDEAGEFGEEQVEHEGHAAQRDTCSSQSRLGQVLGNLPVNIKSAMDTTCNR